MVCIATLPHDGPGVKGTPMQLDKQVEAVLEMAAKSAAPPFWKVSPAEARELYAKGRAVVQPPAPDVARIENLRMPGPAGDITLRHYRPIDSKDSDVLPGLVFFHGGGWVIGDLDTHDVLCRGLANAGRCSVVSVDYRLAPEHKFPGAVDDAIAATHWVHANASALKIDPKRIAVGGDSAGGNLAAVVALAFRDTWAPALSLQLLIYPVTDMRMNTASYVKNGEGYMLTRQSMEYFAEHYLRSAADVKDWRVSPLLANDHTKLAPAYLISAGFDPLCDEGHAYADKLMAAGVTVTYECFEGMVHGFIGMGGLVATANHGVYRCGQALRNAFFTASPSEAAALRR